MLTVEQFLKELEKMPEQAKLQEIRVRASGRWEREVTSVRWEGNHITLETEK